jgi:Putative capsular polysaccharide synthesis protein
VTGIDVYGCDLNTERGFAVIKAGLYNVLILRTDAADEIKSGALAKFLGVDRIALVHANVTAQKEQAETYGEFCRLIRIVPAYLDRMLGSKYSRHFFDEEALGRWRKRYASGGSIVPSSFLELHRRDRPRQQALRFG